MSATMIFSHFIFSDNNPPTQDLFFVSRFRRIYSSSFRGASLHFTSFDRESWTQWRPS